MGELTPKQAAFLIEYQKDRNATQAAIRAGFAAPSAHVTGSRLLRNATIAASLSMMAAKTARRVERSTDWLMRELEDEYMAARQDGAHGPAIRALELMGKELGMFGNAPTTVNVDARSQSVILPAGTTIDDIRALRDQIAERTVSDSRGSARGS